MAAKFAYPPSAFSASGVRIANAAGRPEDVAGLAEPGRQGQLAASATEQSEPLPGPSSDAVGDGNRGCPAVDADLDPSAVRWAFEGIDAVIQTLRVAAGPDMVFEPVSLFSEASRILVPAMEDAGVQRLICLTGFGAGDSRNRGNIFHNIAFNKFVGHAYDDRTIHEQIIKDSQVEWVIVRPATLTNGSKTVRCDVLVDPQQWRCGFISRADVVDFLVKQIESDAYLGKTPV